MAATWLRRITSQISVWKRTRRWPSATSGSCLGSSLTTIWWAETTTSNWLVTMVMWVSLQVVAKWSDCCVTLSQYSICKEPLIELSNPGASSSWFYLTSDDEFIIKTVQHKEAEFLQKLLPGYYMVGCWVKRFPAVTSQDAWLPTKHFAVFLHLNLSDHIYNQNKNWKLFSNQHFI